MNSATTVFGVVYIGLLFSFVLRLRYLDVPAIGGHPLAVEFTRRMGALVMGAAPVWMCDTTGVPGAGGCATADKAISRQTVKVRGNSITEGYRTPARAAPPQTKRSLVH